MVDGKTNMERIMRQVVMPKHSFDPGRVKAGNAWMS